MRTAVAALIAACLSLPAVPAWSQAAQIGVASAAKNDVSGTVGGKRRVISVGAGVFQDEVIATGAESSAQLLFRDETSLTVGPSSRISLDRFVYNPQTRTGDVVIRAGVGAFRFVTGSARPQSYRIVTPAATIGIRGTILEGYVDAAGNLLVVVVEGSISLTLANGQVVVVNAGQFVSVGTGGKVTGPQGWTGPTLNLDAGIRFILDNQGRLLERGSDVLPRWNQFNDALDSKNIDLNFPPSPPPQNQGGTGYKLGQ
ncbi:MAG: FecR domain-containing protein [Hyphomicrobiales bacterium]